MIQKDISACLKSWSDELQSRADRVRNLIGDRHWLSDGHHKEELIREFLSRHLPPTLRISRGFVCSSEIGTPVSPEIDILISDSLGELPWFTEGRLVIAPPSAVRGCLQVKTEYATNELTSVLTANSKSHLSLPSELLRHDVWFGAVFFNASHLAKDEEFSGILENSIARLLGNVEIGFSAAHVPDCIAVLGGPVFVTERKPGALTIRGYSCSGLSAAVLLVHLYDSIPTSGKELGRRGEWTTLFYSAGFRKFFDQTYEFR